MQLLKIVKCNTIANQPSIFGKYELRKFRI